MSILIVDDSRTHRLLLEAILRGAGHREVEMAGSAAEAYERLGMNDPDAPPGALDVQLILMDILMSPVDGIEACARISASLRVGDIPIVMVSALNDEVKLQAAFAAGAVDYVTKPIRTFELLARVRHILRLKHETDLRNARERDLLQVTGKLTIANEALQQLSLQDALTGVGNRRRLDEYLATEWLRAMRNGSTLSLIMVDIDHFKAYNDTYGHGAGDDILTQVAGALRDTLRRPADLVARCGGEEFAIVLPETPHEHALAIGEAIRHAVEGLAVEHCRSPVSTRVTISAGVASTVPVPEASEAALLAQADHALYEAKRAGRNRVISA